MKRFFNVFIILVFFSACKKNSSVQDNYDYPTGAVTSNFSDIPGIRKIEDIDTNNLPVFQRPDGVTPYGYIIDLMPSPEFLQEPKKQIGPSCVAWAFCNVLDYEYKTIERNDIYGAADKIFSPYFLFNQRSQNTNADNGLAPKDAIQILRNQGSCKWADMPDPGTSPYNIQPSTFARTNAGFYKITDIGKMWRLTSLIELPHIKSLIRRNYPLVFAAKIDYGFMKPGSNGYRQTPDGRYVWKSYCNDCTPIPRSPNADMNHAMVLCGYDNDINAFKVLNSWGPSWGNNGYIWIDYDFFIASVLRASDNSPEIYWVETKRVGGTITTNAVSNISSSTSTCGGTVSIDPGITVSEKGICYSEDINPTTGSTLITNISLSSGTGNGSVIANLTGLKPDTRYWVRAYAKTDKGILYGNEVSFTTSTSSGGSGTFTDPRDGQVYPYKQIGTQVWMTKNLNYVPSSGFSTCYDFNSSYCSVYGRLYNWDAAVAAVPSGWHLPSKAEWTILNNYLGGTTTAAGALKQTGSAVNNNLSGLWYTPNTGATNSSGFTALPGGYYHRNSGLTVGVTLYGYWWSTERDVTINAEVYKLSNDNISNGLGVYMDTRNGCSVRCIKD